MKCLSCGFENRSGITFCENCGEKLRLAAQTGAKANGRACPKCGEKVKTGVKFCQNCGAKIPVDSAGTARQTPKYCPECGTAVRAGTKFCENCGLALSGRGITRSRINAAENPILERGSQQKKSSSRRIVTGAIIAVVLLLALAFWSKVITVHPIPVSGSPLLAQASNELMVFQENLPRPQVLEAAIVAAQARAQMKEMNDIQVIGDEIVLSEECGPKLQLSVENVVEKSFIFQEHVGGGGGSLVYTFKNSGEPFTDEEKGYHAVWILGNGTSTTSSCSVDGSEILTCKAPDWRPWQTAQMQIFYNDDQCDFPVAVFNFDNSYAYPTEKIPETCSQQGQIVFTGIDADAESNFAKYYFLIPNSNYRLITTVEGESGNYYFQQGPGHYDIEEKKAYFWGINPNRFPSPDFQNVHWQLWDSTCGKWAASGTIDKSMTEGQGAPEGDPASNTCPEFRPPSIKSFTIERQIFNADNTQVIGVVFSIEYGFSAGLAEIDGSFYLGNNADHVYGRCEITSDKMGVLCSEMLLEFQYGGDYTLYYIEKDEQTGKDCLIGLSFGYMPPPDVTPSPAPDRCDAFTGLDITLVPIGWQKNGSYLLYFKMPGGIPGLTREMPGDNNPPWKITVTINYDYPGNCRIETYNDRLVCSFNIPESYAGTNKGVFMYEAGCPTQNLYWFIDIPSLIPTPTPTSPPTGCGPEPETASTDPAVVKKYHKWCNCKGGSWTSYPDGSGECSVHS